MTLDDAKKCSEALEQRKLEIIEILGDKDPEDSLQYLLGSLTAEMMALRLYLDPDSWERTIRKLMEGARLQHLPDGALGYSLRHTPPPPLDPTTPNPKSPWRIG